MWRYIVSWVIVSWHQIPCPDAGPRTDQYGRTFWPTTTCLVMHMACDTVNKSKWFASRDSAILFYNQAKIDEDNTDLPHYNIDPEIRNVKLDSAKVDTTWDILRVRSGNGVMMPTGQPKD